MRTNGDPKELAFLVARRANDFQTSPYQLGAVLADKWGVFAWGWCHRGDRPYLRSVHAERHAIERANPSRLKRATLYVAGQRRNSGRVILAAPCLDCQVLIEEKAIPQVVFTNPNEVGLWQRRPR